MHLVVVLVLLALCQRSASTAASAPSRISVVSTAPCNVSLIRQLSVAACTRYVSFDCSDDSTMWAAGGCAGLFDCSGVDNIDCDSRQAPAPAHNMSCACGGPPAPAPPLPPAPSPPRANRTTIPLPGPQQRRAIGFELEAFICYTIDTFGQTLDPTRFAPDPAVLNVSQWVSSAKAMGARVAVLTSKHEAGFCLWPSKFSNFTVAHSPTVSGRDLVKEFTDECRRQDILPGLYFTTTDTYNKDNPKRWEIQYEQMQELTQNYGELAYFWFDHHNAQTRDSSGRVVWDTIDDIVRKNQPTCAMLGPDCWLTGAETGFSTYPMWHGVDTTDNTTHGRPVLADATHGNPHGTWFKVWESDCSNYGGCHPWFFGGDSPQSLPLMMAHWEQTYGLGHNYILSLPPNPAGIITPKMAASALAFGEERHRRYGQGSSDPDTPSECELGRKRGRLAQWDATANANGSEGASLTELVLELPGQQTKFDRIFLSEDVLHDGQLVANYAVDVCSALNHSACGGETLQWTPLINQSSAKGGQTIGTHHIDIVNASAKFVRVRLLSVLAGPSLPLISFRVLKVAVPPPEHQSR